MRIAEKVKEFFHNEGIHSTTIQPEFLEIETLYNTTGKCFFFCFENEKGNFDFWKVHRLCDVKLQSTNFLFWHTILDGIATCLNVDGSQDGCALDCPTTEEGCVKATCCQTNNKVH